MLGFATTGGTILRKIPGAAFSACEKGTRWEEALCLLQEMLHRSLTPNVVSCSAAISACEKG